MEDHELSALMAAAAKASDDRESAGIMLNKMQALFAEREQTERDAMKLLNQAVGARVGMMRASRHLMTIDKTRVIDATNAPATVPEQAAESTRGGASETTDGAGAELVLDNALAETPSASSIRAANVRRANMPNARRYR